MAGIDNPGHPSRKFAVHGIFWREGIDWVVRHVPAFFHPPLIWFWTFVFFFVAAPARRTVHQQLKIILPGSSSLTNYLRVFRTFYNFAWTLTDSAVFRLLKAPFRYELSGENFLNELGAAGRAMMLTAHMGSYDLGAGLFIERFHRQIRMVRAPEPDAVTAQHVDLSLAQAGSGAVKIDYTATGNLVAFDVLGAMRAGEIISIQGDRVISGVARKPARLFGQEVFLPSGPFVLALIGETPIYPVFIVRTGFRSYKIVAHPPIECSKANPCREIEIANALKKWSLVLEETIREYWPQWFAFTPVFKAGAAKD